MRESVSIVEQVTERKKINKLMMFWAHVSAPGESVEQVTEHEKINKLNARRRGSGG